MSMRLPGNRDVLGLSEFDEAVVRAFTTESALLHTTERCRWIRHETAVESNHAVLQTLGDLHAATQILRVDVCSETIFGVVCHAHGILDVLERLDRSNRAEDLIAQNFRIIRNLGDDGRRIE